jgi:hypothetical protein
VVQEELLEQRDNQEILEIMDWVVLEGMPEIQDNQVLLEAGVLLEQVLTLGKVEEVMETFREELLVLVETVPSQEVLDKLEEVQLVQLQAVPQEVQQVHYLEEMVVEEDLVMLIQPQVVAVEVVVAVQGRQDNPEVLERQDFQDLELDLEVSDKPQQREQQDYQVPQVVLVV